MEAPFTLTPLQQIWSWLIGQIWYILDILVSWLLRVWLTYYLFDPVVTCFLASFGCFDGSYDICYSCIFFYIEPLAMYSLF